MTLWLERNVEYVDKTWTLVNLQPEFFKCVDIDDDFKFASTSRNIVVAFMH